MKVKSQKNGLEGITINPFRRFKLKRNKSDPVGIFLKGGDAKEILCSGYTTLEKNSEVQICANIIADLVSSMTIFLMQVGDDGDTRIKNELSKKIDVNPNKYMTRKNFIYKIVHTMILESDGNCIVRVREKDNQIDNLEFLKMNAITYDYSETEYLIKYKGIKMYPEEVLHFVLRPSKHSPYIGEGYAEILKEVVMNLSQEQATKNGFLKSKWKPSVIIGVDADSEDLMNEEFRKKVLESYGATLEAGQPWLVPSGEISSEVVKPLTLKDLAIIETMELDKKTVAAAFGIPSFMLGIGDFNKEAYDNFITTKILPIAQNLEQELTRKLLMSPNLYFKFNNRSLFKYNIKELSEVCKELTNMAIMDRNEARNWFDLPPREGLSEMVLLENYVPFARLGDQKKLKEGEED